MHIKYDQFERVIIPQCNVQQKLKCFINIQFDNK